MSLIKENPSFSVLISVYKKVNSKYLDEALDSIENQTVKPSEIVLVEDGPISNSLKEVILKHQEKFGKNFKDIVSPKNQGLGVALRLGTKYISTDWVARMDSDDISVPDRFEKQLNLIKHNPNLAVIGGQVTEFIGDKKNQIGYRRVPTSNELIKQFLKWRSPFNHPTVMINKKVLDEVGGYIPYGNLEDYYLWSRIIVDGYDVANIKNQIVFMRVDDGLYSRRGKCSNIKYVYKLRKFLFKKGIISFNEQIMGDLIMTINIIMPSGLRKIIYQRVLHK
ncbi:glycosyltransferase [Limosilactobacillus reuteri]|uniref:glycosyltransferase n=1 Tax=Limosilactobacillus reuteri TaxID=1598 RepID=UPI002AAC46E5|nr:glycosyltransferase [Limosilactobacillus reuteri]WPU44143.1 glycosyltransferase [Limosilactobacillus reuteri]